MANAGFENAVEAREYAAAALTKRETESGPNRVFYDTRELGYDEDTERSVHVAHGFIDPQSINTAMFEAFVSAAIDYEIESVAEPRRPLTEWERKIDETRRGHNGKER
jgi:hypothetical protein